MNVSFAKENARTKVHLLQSGPETIHWGYWDGSLAPVLNINSGERVTIECVSGNPEWMPPPSRGFEVLPELRNIHQQVKRGIGNHILTGPIFVRGAAVGDVLEVEILGIELRQNWGYNLFRAYGGTLPEEFPYHRIIHLLLDKSSNMAVLPSGLRVPMQPFFGQLGVAPPKDFGRQNSKEPANSVATSIARSSPPAARSTCPYGTKARCSRPATGTPPRATVKWTARP